MRKKIVITGGSGYIGSVLSQLLVDAGYQVRILDRFFFGDTIPQNDFIEKIKVDSRSLSISHLEGAYGVLDLAAISNDPAGELDPVKTLDINYRARRRLQELSSDAKVERYILLKYCILSRSREHRWLNINILILIDFVGFYFFLCLGLVLGLHLHVFLYVYL